MTATHEHTAQAEPAGDLGSVAAISPLLEPIDGRKPRHIGRDQLERLEWHAAEILSAVGLDLSTESTADTPRRFINALIDATDGYEGDDKLVTVFPTECHGGAACDLAQIVEGPIPFYALCEHHAMPFFGRAWVGYIAHERIIGISKLTRLVRVLTRRFGVQERMTHQLATSIERLLDAHGVAVYLDADHLCTSMRGVREDAARTRTTAWLGRFERDAALRAEFLQLAGIGGTGR